MELSVVDTWSSIQAYSTLLYLIALLQKEVLQLLPATAST